MTLQHYEKIGAMLVTVLSFIFLPALEFASFS